MLNSDLCTIFLNEYYTLHLMSNVETRAPLSYAICVKEVFLVFFGG